MNNTDRIAWIKEQILTHVIKSSENRWGHVVLSSAPETGAERRIYFQKNVFKIETSFPGVKPKAWQAVRSFQVSKITDEEVTELIDLLNTVDAVEPTAKDESETTEVENMAKKKGINLKTQMSLVLINAFLAEAKVPKKVIKAIGEDIEDGMQWQLVDPALIDHADLTDEVLEQVYNTCQLKQYEEQQEGEVAGDTPPEGAPTKKPKKGKTKKGDEEKAPAKKKGAAPKWKPGFKRDALETQKPIRSNSKTGDVARAVGDGATLEDIVETTGLTLDQVKFQLRTAARTSGIGFEIDDDGVLTLLGDIELKESKAAAKKGKGKAKKEEAEAPAETEAGEETEGDEAPKKKKKKKKGKK